MYVESYYVTDPNDWAWVIDLWTLNYTSGATTYNSVPVWTINVQGSGHFADGVADDGTSDCAPYVDSVNSAPNTLAGVTIRAYPTLTYNALLYMRWKDLTPAVTDLPVLFGEPNRVTTTEQGNSHPHNFNHPGDAGMPHIHETARVDVYFTSDARPQPALRTYYINDVVGSTAPFHTH